MQNQPQGDLRALKALVGILGVLIVLGTVLVVGVIIHRLYARNPAPSMPKTMVPSPAIRATLAPGEHIAGIAAAGADVAVWVNGPGGDRLLLLDPATGQMQEALRAPQ
jgi:amino acid transporter